MSLEPVYAGEMQFKRYSDTSTQGQTVTFVLPDRESMQAFVGMEGKRFQAVFVQIGDDEQPVPPTPSNYRKPSSTGPACQWLVMRCKEREFQEWVGEQGGFGHVPDEEAASEWVRNVCGVGSRRDIDGNQAAELAFSEHIRKPYLAHTRQPA